MTWCRYFLLLVFLVFAECLWAQSFEFSTVPDRFVQDVVKNLAGIDTEPAKKVSYDFQNTWRHQLDESQKQSIINICQQMRKRRLRTQPYYEYFFSAITYALTQEGAAGIAEFSHLLEISRHAVEHDSHKELAAFFRTLSFFFARGMLYHSHYNQLKTRGGTYTLALLDEAQPVKTPLFQVDTAAQEEEDGEAAWDADAGWGEEWEENENEAAEDPPSEEAAESPSLIFQDTDPPVGGAVIQLKNIDLTLATPYDTLSIRQASGTFMIKDQIFVGTAGEVDWPNDLKGTEGATVLLEGYSFDVRSSKIETQRAKLKYPELFQGAQPGRFAFKSHKRKASVAKSYPRFISHRSNIHVKLPGEYISYVGGFALKGAQKLGTSLSRVPSRLEAGDGQGKIFKTQAVEYVFEDGLITSEGASFVLYYGSDSIYHPQVRMRYNTAVPQLTLLKDKGEFKHAYYGASFFNIDFHADALQWNMGTDSLTISTLNAKNMVPAVFESTDYFNPIRFGQLTGLLSFHPLRLVVQFARIVQSSSYNTLALQDHYALKPHALRAALIFLKTHGYILFNEDNGDIQVLRKAFHYVLSYAKKKDFDNLFISSLTPKGFNASLNFKKGEMNIRGVRHILLTADENVRIQPDSGRVTVLKNRGVQFNGQVHVGDYEYIGTNFLFNYEQNLIQMDSVATIKLKVKADTAGTAKENLDHSLSQTSGTLYVDEPNNKSGIKKYEEYPRFVSESDALVYFDKPKVLGGAYDKSMYFIIDAGFELDSAGANEKKPFKGEYFSGGILPPIKEELIIMPDKSLGFNHQIPLEGYPLYGGEGVLYNNLTLDFGGLRAKGKIDYRTTTVQSDDFVFYPDSVSAVGQKGVVRPGQLGEASYPDAVLNDYKMKWLPLKDSMYIENRGDPFPLYHGTATLDGKANITAHGMYGAGELLSRGTKSQSKDFQFQEFNYSGRHANFQVLTDNPDKPAIDGEDIALNFDLIKNIADIQPEQKGVAAIAFPYAQMKTSITKATWYLDSAKVVMAKPEDIDIASSYFYSTRKELDSLAFSATNAIYDMNTYALNIKGIPYIKVADAEIIPDNHETTILENSTLQPFQNAKLKIDTLNGYHNLFDGHITILSRRKFEGYATYELVNTAQDTFAIKFDKFELQAFKVKRNQYDTMTVSGGVVSESQQLKISPGFYFEGRVKMFANRKNLELIGAVKPLISGMKKTDWIRYSASADQTEIEIDLSAARTTDGKPITAGLFYNRTTDDVYMVYDQGKANEGDMPIFEAEGLLTYDDSLAEFRIEEKAKTYEGAYAGKSFIYNNETRGLIFEGEIALIKNAPEFNMKMTALGRAQPDANQYAMDAMLGLNMKVKSEIIHEMQRDITEVISEMGLDAAYGNEVEILYKMAGFIGNAAAKHYEERTNEEDYVALLESSPKLNYTLFVSNVAMKWSEDHRGFYNTSKIGLSHIQKTDINSLSDGFLEIRKSEEGDDILHLFLQITPFTWYYLGYEEGNLKMLSSNREFNYLAEKNSNPSTAGMGTYATLTAEESEVLLFINEFRKKYYGITEPYNLTSPPEETPLDDEPALNEKPEEKQDPPPFETLPEDEDDGF